MLTLRLNRLEGEGPSQFSQFTADCSAKNACTNSGYLTGSEGDWVGVEEEGAGVYRNVLGQGSLKIGKPKE